MSDAARARPDGTTPCRILWLWSLLSVLCLLIASAGTGRADPAAICDRAAARASAESGVPLDVLLAITRTETGRKAEGRIAPWPWTVNMEGAGHWFGSEDEAKAFAFKEFKRGARSFDVGCFQINYRWHHQAFRSLEHMFEPQANADYAARFLADLHAELGDWSRAAGAYHSRTQHFAERYRQRFDRFRTAVSGTRGLADVAVAQAYGGGSALYDGFFAGGAPSALGSLIPLGGTPSRSPLLTGGNGPLFPNG